MFPLLHGLRNLKPCSYVSVHHNDSVSFSGRVRYKCLTEKVSCLIYLLNTKSVYFSFVEVVVFFADLLAWSDLVTKWDLVHFIL